MIIYIGFPVQTICEHQNSSLQSVKKQNRDAVCGDEW